MANARDISIATINAFNLHDHDGHTFSNSRTAFVDQTAYERRIAWLANMVNRVDSHLIGFQEIWSRAALLDVFEEAGLTDTYDVFARDAPGLGQPQVALAVQKGWTVDEAEWIPDFPETFHIKNLRERSGAEESIDISIRSFSRPVLRCRLRPPVSRRKPPVITVYVVHFKSKAPARLESIGGIAPTLDHHGQITRSAVAHVRRVLEAGALRAMLDAEMKESTAGELSPTIVLGDLNDATHAVSTELLSAQPGYRLTASSQAGNRSDKGLYTVETLQQYRSQRHVYYTYVFRNQTSTLDHIMVSEEFYDHSRKRHWSFSEMEIFNDHLSYADESDRERKRLFRETGAVDHGIVRARFAWDPISDDIQRVARRMQQEQA